MSLGLILLISAALTVFGVWLLIKTSIGNHFLDHCEKAHAMHVTPVPRIGGVPLAATVSIIALAMVYPRTDAPVLLALIPALFLALFSLIDDRRGLPAWLRLGAHIIAAMAVVAIYQEAFVSTGGRAGGVVQWLLLQPLGAVVLVIGIVWMTNLYNFMDGANGLAGFMGLIGFGAFAVAAGASIDISQGPARANEIADLAAVCAAVAGACAGFLGFNFPSGRVFLGDVGSVFLGFMAGVVGLLGVLLNTWPLWFPLLVFSPFIVDASVTLLKRLVRGERIWLPHRQHVYQRLITQCGWTHRRTALCYALIMLLAAGHGVSVLIWQKAPNASATDPSPLPILGAWVLIYAGLLAAVEWYLRKQKLTKTNMSSKEDQGSR